ncbi:hypothetical protein AK812_SmicGene39559 [Symbiodinium microadriaticum]|uniref:Uncharacterized protein n=1 Tax=Symbiodinium microadriaticum TaxID=2951 RepID=A0A1Q9CAX0_SYMMI|nr:hypothetical protein AK812_SmicGene39559 [Symbiodinium microadriaticum]
MSGTSRALKRFAKRSGGGKTAAGAMLVGGVATMATLREVPRVPATCIGSALACYAVQLPKGNRVGDSTREVGRQVAYLWEALAGAGEQGANFHLEHFVREPASYQLEYGDDQAASVPTAGQCLAREFLVEWRSPLIERDICASAPGEPVDIIGRQVFKQVAGEGRSTPPGGLLRFGLSASLGSHVKLQASLWQLGDELAARGDAVRAAMEPETGR